MILIEDIYNQDINFLFGSGASFGLLPTLQLQVLTGVNGRRYTLEELATKFEREKDRRLIPLFMHYYANCIRPAENLGLEAVTTEPGTTVIKNYRNFLLTVLEMVKRRKALDRRCNVFTTNYDGCFPLVADALIEEGHVDFILNDERFGFDKDRIYAVGHSLGGFVCGQLSASRPEIRKAVLITPCDIGRLPVIREQAPDYYRAVCEVLEESADWLTGTSGEKLRREAEEHSETLRLESAAAGLAAKPVLCISPSLDVYTPPELNGGPLQRAVEAQGGTAFRHVVWPTDHFLSDYRLKTSETVLEFLKS